MCASGHVRPVAGIRHTGRKGVSRMSALYTHPGSGDRVGHALCRFPEAGIHGGTGHRAPPDGDGR